MKTISWVLVFAILGCLLLAAGYEIIVSQKLRETKITKLREDTIPKEKLRYAGELVKQKKYKRACIEFKKIAEEYSNHVDVIGIYAWLDGCYKQQGLDTEVVANARSAIDRARQLLKEHPDEYHLNCSIGFFYSSLGEWNNVRKSFQKYLEAEALAEKKDPFLRARAHMEIAKTYENEGKWLEMVGEYQKVLDDPENPYKSLKAEAQFSIAEVYSNYGIEIFGTEEKAKEETLKAYQKVIDMFPEREYTKWSEQAEKRIRQLKEIEK